MSVKSWSEKALSIPGPAGELDIRLGQQIASDTDSSSASYGFIMCHPHPLYSGTMDNKVVTTLVRGASKIEFDSLAGMKVSGLETIRFNFRGVGHSQGEHDHGKGEQDDLATVVDYALNELGWQKVFLAGFSFGAGVACLYSCQHAEKVAGMFLIAPAVHHFEAPSALPFEFESHVYMGDADEVVPFDEVEHWVDLLTPQPHFHIFEDASHFFHGRLVDLRETFLDDLKKL